MLVNSPLSTNRLRRRYRKSGERTVLHLETTMMSFHVWAVTYREGANPIGSLAERGGVAQVLLLVGAVVQSVSWVH